MLFGVRDTHGVYTHMVSRVMKDDPFGPSLTCPFGGPAEEECASRDRCASNALTSDEICSSRHGAAHSGVGGPSIASRRILIHVSRPVSHQRTPKR